MLHRPHQGNTIVIGQPAHARMVGVVGRAWGGSGFAVPPQWGEVCVAADTHEIGMAAWEMHPTFNPHTGLPHAYLELSHADHLALWHDVGPLLLSQGRYVALIVSRHGTWIFNGYETPPTDPAERTAVANYLRRERAFQQRMRRSLAEHAAYAEAVTLAALARTRKTFIVWDRIAVHACYGVPGVWGIPPVYHWEHVPTANGAVAPLTLAFVAPDHWTLDPWPLTVPELRLAGEGRLLGGPYPDTVAMHAAIAAAPWVRWESRVTPLQ